MGGASEWNGGDRLESLFEGTDLLQEGMEKKIAGLDGAHQMARQLLGSLTGNVHSDLPWHRKKNSEGKITFHPQYFKLYKQFLEEIGEEVNHATKWFAKDEETKTDLENIGAKINMLRGNLTASCEPNVENNDIIECDKSMPNDVLALNEIMANIHKNLYKTLVSSIKNVEIGKSFTEEQCVVLVPKGQQTPEFATSFCQPENFNNSPDMNALVFACPNKGWILLRRLNVLAGENQGLHTTEIRIRPDSMTIKPNINSQVESQFKGVMKHIGAKYMEGHEWHKKVKDFDQVNSDMKFIGQNLKWMIRPNSGMPLSSYGILEDQV